jgi:hypothetical protein
LPNSRVPGKYGSSHYRSAVSQAVSLRMALIIGKKKGEVYLEALLIYLMDEDKVSPSQ